MEKWEGWTINPEIPAKLYLQALIDDKDGLRLVLTDVHENTYTFLFDGLVLSYRNTDEGTLIRTLEHLYIHYDPDFFGDWTLFQVTDSRYLEWLFEESENMYETVYNIQHYVFLTSHDVIEVLSTDPPILILFTASLVRTFGSGMERSLHIEGRMMQWIAPQTSRLKR